MNQFPVDFTPCNVMNAKRLRRERRMREKIEREKAELRARVVEEVTKDDEEAWWWRVPTDRKWEKDTIEEINFDLLNQNWLFGHFPHYQTAIVCTREPTEEEISQFFE